MKDRMPDGTTSCRTCGDAEWWHVLVTYGTVNVKANARPCRRYIPVDVYEVIGRAVAVSIEANEAIQVYAKLSPQEVY